MTPEQKNKALLADLDDEEQRRIRTDALLRGCLNEQLKGTP